MFLHRAMRYYRLWIYSCNLTLLISVVAFVSLASWILSDFRMALFPSVKFHHPSMLYAYLALALQGGLLQAIGCVGAVKMNERLLNTYWTLMLLLLFGDVVVGVVWIFRFQHLTSSLKDELRSRVLDQYGVDYEFQLLWDQVQTESECCGVTGPEDYNASTWIARQRQENPNHRQLVPKSCCRMMVTPHSQGEAIPLNSSCVETNQGSLIYVQGCHEAVKKWLQKAAHVLSVVGYCVIAFLKLCFLGILRYEIREMIQKIKILRDLDDPVGSILCENSTLKNLRQSSHNSDKPPPPNGNNNDSESSPVVKRSTHV